MNWDAIGAVGQVVSGLALVLVIVQIRHARLEAQRAAARDLTERNVQLQMAAATDERLAAIRWKANDALRGDRPPPPYIEAAITQLGLAPPEVITLNSFNTARWSALAHAIAYVDEMLPGDRAQFDAGNRTNVREPQFQYWYGFNKDGLDPDAVRYLDNLLVQSG